MKVVYYRKKDPGGLGQLYDVNYMVPVQENDIVPGHYTVLNKEVTKGRGDVCRTVTKCGDPRTRH